MTEQQEEGLIVSSMPYVTIYSDGSYKPQLGTGGYGSIAVCGNETRFFYGGYYDVSNNAMELMAALMAIRSLATHCRILIISDSKYLVNGINSWVSGWHANGWTKADGRPVQNKELWEEMWMHMQQHLIKAIWKRGHQDSNFDNTVCDQFACIGAYKEAKMNIPSHLLDIRRS